MSYCVHREKKTPTKTLQSIRYRWDSNDEYSRCVWCCKLIILMALAHGKSRVRVGPITLHTQTSIHVMQLLTKVAV